MESLGFFLKEGAVSPAFHRTVIPSISSSPQLPSKICHLTYLKWCFLSYRTLLRFLFTLAARCGGKERAAWSDRWGRRTRCLSPAGRDFSWACPCCGASGPPVVTLDEVAGKRLLATHFSHADRQLWVTVENIFSLGFCAFSGNL